MVHAVIAARRWTVGSGAVSGGRGRGDWPAPLSSYPLLSTVTLRSDVAAVNSGAAGRPPAAGLSAGQFTATSLRTAETSGGGEGKL